MSITAPRLKPPQTLIPRLNPALAHFISCLKLKEAAWATEFQDKHCLLSGTCFSGQLNRGDLNHGVEPH